MKHKLSVTLEREVILELNDKLREGLFRNKSHLIEYAVKKFLKEGRL